MNNEGVSKTSAPNDSSSTSSEWRMPSVVAAICLSVFVATASYSTGSGDVAAANVLSWQLTSAGDPIFRDTTYPPIDDHPGRDIWVIERSDGQEVIGRSPGAVAAAIPAYALFGRETFSLIPGAVTAALITALAVLLLALTLRERLAPREAALGALVFALGTPVWTVAADGMWPHTITIVGVCGMGWAATRERWWLVGLFGGVVVWGRLHAAVIVAVFGLLLGWRRRDAGLTAVIGASSGLMLLLQAAWTRWIYGDWNPMASYETDKFGEYAETHTLDVVNQLGFWVSPGRGLLVWTPVILLLVPSLLKRWTTLPEWSRALLLGGIAYTLLQGLLNRFSGGDAFYGYRLTLELLACAAPALAYAATSVGPAARRLLAPVLIFQALIIAAGAANQTLGSTTEEVWTHHALFSVMVQQPYVLLGFAATGLAATYLACRIWAGTPQASLTDVPQAVESR